MGSVSSELGLIKSCLNEIESISQEPSYKEVIVLLNNYKATEIYFSNYAVGSFTISKNTKMEVKPPNFVSKKNDTHEVSFILAAYEFIKSNRNCLSSIEGLISLNQIICNDFKAGMRKTYLNDSYPFPSPEVIAEGVEILFNFLEENKDNLLLSRIAFIQGMISLHPFEDGNHRTFRLLLDFWLQEMEIPCTTIEYGTDLIIANPTDRKVFSLEQAVQKVIHGIGNTIWTENHSNGDFIGI